MLENILGETIPFSEPKAREQFLEKLTLFGNLLKKWNKVYNLTAITDTTEIAHKHFLDSLLVLPYLQGNRILDVGTGAGLPGIPLALSCPDKQFVLLDSNSKKTRFLKQAVTELALKNVEIVHSRIEEYAPEIKFDIVLTRAFAQLDIIVQKTAHVLAPQGEIIAMKGKCEEEELSALSGEFEIREVVRLDTTMKTAQQLGARHIIRITKKGI